MRRSIVLVLAACFITITASAQLEYPYRSDSINLSIEGKQVTMSYMDIPSTGNDKTILLLHGKNFNGYYWKTLLPFLKGKGYRIIIPDQVGWGKSSKPDIHYSFHLLASNTLALLDSLKIQQVIIIGHSMGGMLATRFSLMYPGRVEKLILENPIGLEDYKTFVPYQSTNSLFAKEKKATYASYKKYQQSYYPEWKPEYEQYVAAQAVALDAPDFPAIAWANALTYQMIYEQPVLYEFPLLKVPVLLVIGTADRTIVGKDLLDPVQQSTHGVYANLGKRTRGAIPNARLIEMDGVGHIPHIQSPVAFQKIIESFLESTTQKKATR